MNIRGKDFSLLQRLHLSICSPYQQVLLQLRAMHSSRHHTKHVSNAELEPHVYNCNSSIKYKTYLNFIRTFQTVTCLTVTGITGTEGSTEYIVYG